MSWRLRLSVETILRLTPAVLGSTVFSIAGLCAAHACLDDQALLAAREAIGSSLQTLGSVYAVLLAFVVFVVWQHLVIAKRSWADSSGKTFRASTSIATPYFSMTAWPPKPFTGFAAGSVSPFCAA
jgi:hypothetical protein